MESVLPHYLLLILLSFHVFSTAPASGAVVLDTNGRPVLSGLPYYLRAAQARNDGNLGMESINGSCPLNVFLKPFPYGPAVLLFPEEARQSKTILLAEKLMIMFAAPTPCNASTMWTLDRQDTYVTTGGVQLPPSTLGRGGFSIMRYPLNFPGQDVYQFMWCTETEPPCSSIGIVGSTQLLGQSSEPIALKFIKVPEEASISSAFMRPTAA